MLVKTLLAISSLFMFYGLLKFAWICDDAFFTLRAALNFNHGLGPVWSPGQRLQSFTNPLWMFLMSIHLFGLSNQVFMLSLFFILLSLLLLYRLSITQNSQKSLLVLMVILISSKTFLTFSFSGLETPLTFFLLTANGLLYYSEKSSLKKQAYLSLLLGAYILEPS